MQLQSRPSHPALAWAVTLAQAALLILSVMLIFIPETRTPALEMNPMKVAFFALLGGTAVEGLLRGRRSGVYSLTIPQIHEGIKRGTIKGAGPTVLEFVSGTAAVVACTTGYWPW